MHIKDTLINFLYDKDYYIAIYDNYIYVYNYINLISLNSDIIVLKLPKFILNIEGELLYITKMTKNEILIKGKLSKVGIKYE